MKRALTIMIAGAVLLGAALAADKLVKMSDLPLAVREAVQAQTKGAEVKKIMQEVISGETFYEVESIVSGRTRDLLFNTAGTAVEIEEEVTIDSIPAPARTAIEKKAAGGKIIKVETVAKGQTVLYSADYIKAGKNHEFEVKADGSPGK